MLRIESEIISSWKNKDKIVVSICTLTYNHENFIKDCIEGILMQETDFAFELLIHDDASTDNTPNIIKEYTSKYPLIIKPIYQSENQHSQGINPSVFYNYPRAHGEYIAWCEGDDYWIDKNKLAIQVEAMRKYPQCELSFHSAIRTDYSDKKLPDRIMGVYAQQDKIIPLEEIIHKHNGMIPTASCIVTQEVKEELLNFQKTRNYLSIGDLYMQFFGSIKGGALYINKIMSVYRICTPSSWSNDIRKNPIKKIQHELAMIKSYEELDKITKYEYQNEFKYLIAYRVYRLGLTYQKYSLQTYNHIYNEFYKILTPKIQELNKLDEKFLIYGAGTGAEYIYDIIDTSKVIGFIDQDSQKKLLKNKQVFHISEIEQFKNKKIIVSLFGRSRGVIKDLTEIHNIQLNNIITFDFYLIDALNGL